MSNTAADLERAEEQIRQLNSRLHARIAEEEVILEAIPDGVVVYDREGRIVRMNATAEQMLGYSRETMNSTLEERSAAVVHPRRPDGSPYPHSELPATRALNGEVVRSEEMVLNVPARGGAELRVTVSSAPICGDDESVIGCVTTFTDTEALQHANELVAQTIGRLQRTNAEFEVLLSALPAGLIVYDPDGKITRMNTAAMEMLGYREDTWKLPVSKRVGSAVVAYLPDGSLCKTEDYAALRALRGEVVRNQDLYIHLPEAPEKDFWGSFSAAPVLTEDGRLAGAVVTMMDTGTLHELNEQLTVALHAVKQRETALSEANEQLRAQAGELREAADMLEQRVQERTVALEASRVQLRSLSRRLVDLQERERRYVADQLYNEAGQVLAALRMYLSRGAAGGAGSRRLEETQQLLDRVMQDLHHLATHLRPATLDRLGLISALRQYAEAWGRKNGVDVAFSSPVVGRLRLSGEAETAVYRVVQDALMNVAQHAGATRVAVEALESNDGLTVVINDNGAGFDPEATVATASTGLLGMQERVESVGGRLRVESSPGSGTIVIVEAPIDRETLG